MKKIILVSMASLISISALAAGGPTNFAYQGKLMNAAGTAPLSSVVGLRLDVMDPSGKCLIYSETQNAIDLSQTNGLFAVLVGSSVNDSKRTAGIDLGLTMTQVFANAGTQLVVPGGACTSGYTPLTGDGRLLHVSVTSGGVTTTITPDLPIGSVPNAMVAETVQGLTPAQLVPAGSILSFAGLNCPSGYLAADGNSYSASTYPSLASALINGSAYLYGGTVAGGSFNVPNASGAFLRGAGSQTVSGVPYSATLGQTQSDQLQGHDHTMGFWNRSEYSSGFAPGSAFNGRAFSQSSPGITISNDGSNGTPRYGAETRPMNIAVKYCIKY